MDLFPFSTVGAKLLVHETLIGRNVRETVLVLRSVHNELMRFVVDTNIVLENDDVTGVAKNLCHFLKRDAFGFRKEEVGGDGSEATDDDKDAALC